jgi:hypothetical protein
VPVRDGDRLRITTTLSNASARPVLLTGLEPAPGLRVAEVLDGAGRAVALPYGLPPGDYDPPVDPYEGRGEDRRVVVVLEVADCARLPRVGPDYFLPLVEGRISSLEGEQATTSWGGDVQPLSRLRDDVCTPDAAAVRGSSNPSLAEISEQALHALRRDHPFLTPD